ncbi:F-box protein CPR1-like [Nicotiana tomentosiformis]|uniref:F-box protein CPR1-like n=1 Tax=Nicotiana tomentosiformis TaxID=4098 RepID=UPI00388C6C93
MGYDSRSGDYKILKIMEEEDFGCEIPSEILALKSGSWKKIDKHPHGIRSISRNYYVVSFNISNEVYGEMPLPEQICLMSNIGIGISVLEGMLCVYSTSNFVGGDTFKLWIMKDYGIKKSWSALFTVGDPDIFSPLQKYRFPKGEVLFWCLDLQCSGLWPQADTFQNGFVYLSKTTYIAFAYV